jgi:hypothetical protein
MVQRMFNRHKTPEFLCIGRQFEPRHILGTSFGLRLPAKRVDRSGRLLLLGFGFSIVKMPGCAVTLGADGTGDINENSLTAIRINSRHSGSGSAD